MKKLEIASIIFLLSCGVHPLQAETIFNDDFSDGNNWQDNWYQLGSAGGAIVQVDGHLELDRSNLGAEKQLSAVTKKKFNFKNGLTFEGVLTSFLASDEVQFWVASEDGKGQAEDDPWFTPNWVRVMLAGGNIFYQRSNPGGGGGGGDAGQTPMQIETPYKISIYMLPKECTVYVDGKEILQTDHGQNFTEGYLIFAAWTTGPGKGNHKLDDVFIYEGNYNPSPRSQAVVSEGKLTATWGGLKSAS